MAFMPGQYKNRSKTRTLGILSQLAATGANETLKISRRRDKLPVLC